MPITIESIQDFTLEAYRRVAWHGETLQISPKCLHQIQEWRDEFLAVLATQANTPIYGVNVGAGDGSFQFLDDQSNYHHGLNSATSFGRPLPEHVVRGMVFTRLSSFVDGTSAVSPELVEHVAAMLQGPLPPVPAEGTGGSGEILPLGHLFHDVPARIPLGPKESMALVNGAPCAGALVADTAIRARSLLATIEQAFALACDALNAPKEHFDSILGATWGQASEGTALDRLRELLSGSPHPRNHHQARVSVRILPRVLGSTYQAVDQAEEVAQTAIRGAGDNPVFISSSKGTEPARILSNGSFHNHRAIIAIDNIGRVFAELTQLAQHLMHAIYQDKDAMPNQDNLALGTAYMVAADWSEEARKHAAPSMLSFAAVGQNDVTNPLFSAWRDAVRIEECLVSQLAILSTMASQSLYSTGRETTPALQPYLAAVRNVVSPIDQRRDVGTEIGQLANELQNQHQSLCAA